MSVKQILIIGGTGAQGIPVINHLVRDGKYKVKVLTRDPTHPRAVKLAENPNVQLVKGSLTNEDDLNNAFSGCDGAFINIDGFAIGEKAETFWGIRIFELAQQHKIKHYVFSGLQYTLYQGGWDPKYHISHMIAKARTTYYMRAFPSTPEARWSVLNTGLYAEMLSGGLIAPHFNKNTQTFDFHNPMGDVPLPIIALDDIAFYARWIFDHPEESSGLELTVATEDLTWDHLVKTFTKVTGKPARNIDFSQSMDKFFSTLPFNTDRPVAYEDPNSLTFRQNFTNFWNYWREVRPKRDYALLDRIHPNRLTMERWMIENGFTGQATAVLKVTEDDSFAKYDEKPRA